MRYVDIEGKTLLESEIDLTKGELIKNFSILKENAVVPDGINKFAYTQDDYEIGCLYVLKPIRDNQPTQIDKLEATVTYMAMMLDMPLP